jgi:hypothetical protein
MPDTVFIEGGRESPRRYTPAELEAIAKAAGVEKCGPISLEKLQRAAEAYQWASLVDDKDKRLSLSATNKSRREQLNHILKLAAQGASAEEINLDGLDAIGTQLLLSSPIPQGDPRRLGRAARRALSKLSRSGPDPKRARRQFIGDLARIYTRVTRRPPGRGVHEEEVSPFLTTLRDYGPFPASVKAALEPFKATKGCEADIKAVLHQLKRASGKRKNAAAARR